MNCQWRWTPLWVRSGWLVHVPPWYRVDDLHSLSPTGWWVVDEVIRNHDNTIPDTRGVDCCFVEMILLRPL